MRPHSRTRVVLVAAAAGLIGGTLLAGPARAAAPDPSALSSKLSHQLGARSAGSYIDHSTGKLVVTVTTASDSKAVRDAGGVPKTVARSGAELQRATDTLSRTAKVPGTAWGVDPATDQVLLSIDDSVTGSGLAKVDKAAKALGSAVRVEHVAGRFKPLIAGGDAIYGGNVRCSLGFNVTGGGTSYFLTAGHCGAAASTWYSNSAHTTLLGTNRAFTFPSHDYAIVRYTGSVSHPSTVDLYGGTQTISSAGSAVVGESVRRSGSTSGVHSGSVTALNQTVNYAEGTVTGMIRTNVCAEPGDSGGPLFDGSKAVGLTSGGSGNCSSGGTTFFQPVTAALSAYGVTIP